MESTVLSTRLRSLMEIKGLTMNRLGAELEIHPSVISRHLSGEREPTTSVLMAYAKYFGVSTDWLLGLNDDQFNSLTKDEVDLLVLYHAASEDEKRVVHAILNKYRHPQDSE